MQEITHKKLFLLFLDEELGEGNRRYERQEAFGILCCNLCTFPLESFSYSGFATLRSRIFLYSMGILRITFLREISFSDDSRSSQRICEARILSTIHDTPWEK